MGGAQPLHHEKWGGSSPPAPLISPPMYIATYVAFVLYYTRMTQFISFTFRPPTVCSMQYYAAEVITNYIICFCIALTSLNQLVLVDVKCMFVQSPRTKLHMLKFFKIYI